LGIKWESNAYNWFPQEATRRTEAPTLKYETVLDSTRWTGARGFLNRASRAWIKEVLFKIVRFHLDLSLSPPFTSAHLAHPSSDASIPPPRFLVSDPPQPAAQGGSTQSSHRDRASSATCGSPREPQDPGRVWAETAARSSFHGCRGAEAELRRENPDCGRGTPSSTMRQPIPGLRVESSARHQPPGLIAVPFPKRSPRRDRALGPNR
jgi:hypothetical protein